MVNIQVLNNENKKIETVRCEENEIMSTMNFDIESKYGETQFDHIERDDSKKTPMIRYYFTTEKDYTVIVSMSIYQAERVNDYLATYEAFCEVFTDEEIKEKKATKPQHRFYRISKHRPSRRDHYRKVKESQWRNKCTEQGIESAIRNIRYAGRIVNDEITEMTVHTRDLNGEEIIDGIWIKCSDPRYDWDDGYFSFMVTYRPSRINWEQTYEEQKMEAHEELLRFVEVALKYFEEEKWDVNVEVFGDDNEFRGIETLIPQTSTIEETEETATEEEAENVENETTETETGDEKMTQIIGNKEYDRETVLLETGEFTCGNTFHYDGEPITVGDVLDAKEKKDDDLLGWVISYKVTFDVAEEGWNCRFLLKSNGDIAILVSKDGKMHKEIVYSPTTKGYDRDFVLVEGSQLYSGKPITVGDIIDNHRMSVVSGDKNVSIFVCETHHILMMSRHSCQVVYAPRFEELYSSASNFIEAMTNVRNTYYDPDKEISKRVDYSSYKGRLYKDLVKMTAEELEAIDNEESSEGFPIEDVEAYVNWLVEDAPKPHNWQHGVVADEEHCDYFVRNKIEWGIRYCEEYCSPSLEFFRLAQGCYASIQDDSEAEDIADEKFAVEFECEYGSASFSGFAYYNELEDDEPLYFYDRHFGWQSNLQNAHLEGSEEDKAKLIEAFCDDFLFTQFLSDYAEKSATITREGYTLHINDGEQFSLSFEKVGNFSTDSVEGTYDVRIIPSTDIVLDDDFTTDLVCTIGQIWNTDARVEDGRIICEFDKHFFDEDSDFSSVVDEMTGDYECLYKQQITRNLGANGIYQLSLVDKFTREGDSRVYDDALIRESASVFEIQLEELDWRELVALSDDDVQELAFADIEENFACGGDC